MIYNKLTCVSEDNRGLGKFEYIAVVVEEPCERGEAGSSCISKLSN